MKGKRILISVLALGLMLALVVGLTQAQEPGPRGEAGVKAAPVGATASAPLSTSFTYQGRLTDGGGPANGSYDFQFKLYDAASGGGWVGTVTEGDVTVSDGLFMVELDFGNAFTGDARWLEIGVRPGASAGAYTTLTPRQALTATPYALYALGAPWSGLTGIPPDFADGVDADTLGGLSCGNGQVAKWNGTSSQWQCGNDETSAGGGGWSLTGNTGTNPATNFLGTTDDQALELRVNNARALRLEPNADSPNLIGGHSSNSVTSGVYGATIGGGGGTNSSNRVTANCATIGGGTTNTASGLGATVGGGNDNTSSNAYATVGGGQSNLASGSGSGYATVGGGHENTASGDFAAVGGGEYIRVTGRAATVAGGSYITVTSEYAVVGGGQHNIADDPYATVGGGRRNIARAWGVTVGGGSFNTASGDGATIGGGGGNTASAWGSTTSGGDYNTASGVYATIGGGYSNTASGYAATVGGGVLNHADALTVTIGGGEYISVTGQAATVAGGSYITVTGDYAAVGGGQYNTASGEGATIPGGRGNTAQGDYSFAAGRRAKANHDGAFVWADSTDADFASTVANQFAVRANGGALITGANDAPMLTVTNLGSDDGLRVNMSGDDGLQIGDGTSFPDYGVYIPPDGVPFTALYVQTADANGEWALATGDKISAANVTFSSLTLVAVVDGPDSLTPGDLVAAAGLADPLPDTLSSLPRVRLADAKTWSGVIGVVEGRMALQPMPGKADKDGNAPLELHSVPGPAKAGDYVALTVLGVARVKADATAGDIVPGQRLTAADQPGHVRALCTRMLEGMMVTEGAPVIGIALAPLDKDSGTIPVFVTLQ